MKRRILVLMMLFSGLLCSESFKNYSVSLPVVGWMGFDSSFESINQMPWGFSDNFVVGVGLKGAIDKPLWWTAKTLVGVGSYKLANTYLALGLLYNLAEGDVQPFLGIDIHYLQLFGSSENVGIASEASYWFGIRPEIGVEVSIIEDLSLSLSGSYLLFLNPTKDMRHAFSAMAAFNLYL